jgi:O-antigen ligase
LIEAVAVGCLVSWQKFDFKKISYSFVAAGLLQGILAIYQFLTQAVVGNKWLGIATQAVGQSGVSVVEGAGRWLRAYGSLPHPNLLAGYLAASLFFLLGLLFAYYRKNCSAPRQFSAARVGEAIFLFGSLVIITYGLLLTFSRSAWLGTIVGLLFVWFFPGRRRDPLARKFFIKINLFILLVVILFVANYGALLFPRLTASSRLEAQSITERQAGWQEAITLIKSRPVWGVGLGAYTRALYDQDKTRSAWEYQPVHNLDLLIMAELGMVGWLLLLVVILLWLYQGLAKLFRGENQFGMFVGAPPP